ncbi:MAG: hypothetical protein ACJ8FS_05215 [Sphingomicrobium sp.]
MRINQISNLRFQTSNLQYGPVTIGAPNTSRRDVLRYQNCTAAQQTITAEYQKQASGTAEVTITNGLKSTTQIKAGVRAQGLPLNPEFEAVQSQEISFVRSEKNTFTTADGEKRTIPFVVPPYNLVRGEVLITQNKADLPFTGNAIVDADVEFEWNDDDGAISGYRHNTFTKPLSWAVPNVNDRSFPVTGVIHGGTSTETDAQLISRPLSRDDLKDCPSPAMMNGLGQLVSGTMTRRLRN